MVIYIGPPAPKVCSLTSSDSPQKTKARASVYRRNEHGNSPLRPYCTDEPRPHDVWQVFQAAQELLELQSRLTACLVIALTDMTLREIGFEIHLVHSIE